MSEGYTLPDDVRRRLDQAQRLMTAVNDAVMGSGVNIEDLTVAADATGQVAISGIAPSPEAAERAAAVAAAVEGVTEVINSLIVDEQEPQRSSKRWWELWR